MNDETDKVTNKKRPHDVSSTGLLGCRCGGIAHICSYTSKHDSVNYYPTFQTYYVWCTKCGYRLEHDKCRLSWLDRNYAIEAWNRDMNLKS